MKYLLLIYTDEKTQEALPEPELARLYAEYLAFTDDVKKAGKHIASQRLRPVSTATTVRTRGGKTLLTDGPFAETKEQLGGFYMIEAKDLDEATAWAERCPASRHGTVEVRPIWEMPAGPQ